MLEAAVTLCILFSSPLGWSPERLVGLASERQDQARYQEAERLYLWAVPRVGESAARAEALNNLASLYFETGRFTKALRFALQALELRKNLGGADDPETARMMDNLAAIYHAKRRYGNAEALYRRAVTLLSAHAGHPELPLALNNLGILRLRRGHAAEAEKLVLRAIEIWKSRDGAEHPNLARGLANLAQIRERQGLHAEAASLLRDAMRLVEQAWGADHAAMSHLRAAYARIPSHTVHVSSLVATARD